MRNKADFMVVLGAFIVALTAVEFLGDAIKAAAEGRYYLASFHAIAAFGCGNIAREVWRAA